MSLSYENASRKTESNHWHARHWLTCSVTKAARSADAGGGWLEG
jgi:hypothetical protein